jgi:hypothetical protein
VIKIRIATTYTNTDCIVTFHKLGGSYSNALYELRTKISTSLDITQFKYLKGGKENENSENK